MRLVHVAFIVVLMNSIEYFGIVGEVSKHIVAEVSSHLFSSDFGVSLG